MVYIVQSIEFCVTKQAETDALCNQHMLHTIEYLRHDMHVRAMITPDMNTLIFPLPDGAAYCMGRLNSDCW